MTGEGRGERAPAMGGEGGPTHVGRDDDGGDARFRRTRHEHERGLRDGGMGPQPLFHLGERDPLLPDLDGPVGAPEEEEATVGQELRAVFHDERGGGAGAADERRGDHQSPGRGVCARGDLGERRPGEPLRVRALSAPGDAAGLRGAEDLDRPIAERLRYPVGSRLVERPAGREDRPASAAQLAKVLRGHESAQVDRGGHERGPLLLEQARHELAGVRVHLRAKRAARAQGPEEAEEQAVDVMMRDRGKHRSAGGQRPPLPLQPVDLLVEVPERLRDGLVRPRRPGREELEPRSPCVERRPRTGLLRRRLTGAKHGVPAAERDLVIGDGAVRVRRELREGSGLRVRRHDGGRARLPQAEEPYCEGVRVVREEEPAPRSVRCDRPRQRVHVARELGPGHGPIPADRDRVGRRAGGWVQVRQARRDRPGRSRGGKILRST